MPHERRETGYNWIIPGKGLPPFYRTGWHELPSYPFGQRDRMQLSKSRLQPLDIYVPQKTCENADGLPLSRENRNSRRISTLPQGRFSYETYVQYTPFSLLFALKEKAIKQDDSLGRYDRWTKRRIPMNQATADWPTISPAVIRTPASPPVFKKPGNSIPPKESNNTWKKEQNGRRTVFDPPRR